MELKRWTAGTQTVYAKLLWGLKDGWAFSQHWRF